MKYTVADFELKYVEGKTLTEILDTEYEIIDVLSSKKIVRDGIYYYTITALVRIA